MGYSLMMESYLQAKEKLINSLKQGAAGAGAPQIVFTELEEIRQERDFLREELQQSKYKLEQMKVELYVCSVDFFAFPSDFSMLKS